MGRMPPAYWARTCGSVNTREEVEMQTRSSAGLHTSCGSSDELVLQAAPSCWRMLVPPAAHSKEAATSAQLTGRNIPGSIQAPSESDKLDSSAPRRRSRSGWDRLPYEANREPPTRLLRSSGR